MKSLIKILGRLLVLAVLFGAGGLLAKQTGVSPVLCSLLMIAVYFGSTLLPAVPIKACIVSFGVDMEIWTSYIDENLYKDNGFLMASMDHSEYVNALTVHSPQAGDDGGVEENRSVFPAAVTSRTDTTLDWDISEYTADPWKVTNAEEIQLSYNKLDSMLYSRRAILDQKIADGALFKIAPTGTANLRNGGGINANILRSSGIPNNDDSAEKVYSAAYLGSATGYRLNFGLYDIRQAKLHLDNLNVPKSDRHLMVSANALDQIVSDLIATKYRDSVTLFDSTTGELSMIMGFKVWSRSSVVRYNNADTPVPKAPTAAGAATDNDAILFWHKAMVRRAQGDTLVFTDDTGNGRPEYYGKIFSLLKRFGMSISRNDEVGVGAIVQAAYNPPIN